MALELVTERRSALGGPEREHAPAEDVVLRPASCALGELHEPVRLNDDVVVREGDQGAP